MEGGEGGRAVVARNFGGGRTMVMPPPTGGQRGGGQHHNHGPLPPQSLCLGSEGMRGPGGTAAGGVDPCGEQERVGECTKITREKKGRNKSVSWGGETRAVSHEKTSLEGILKRSHVAKPRGQKICKERG